MELLMALPVMALAMQLVVQLTFDAAFMSGLSVATIEAAREAAQAFPSGVSLDDPDGEPSFDPRDMDDLADRLALIVQRRLQILKLRIAAPDPRDTVARAGVHLSIRQGGRSISRGDWRIPLRPSANAPEPDELELTIAVRLSDGISHPDSAPAASRPATWLSRDDVYQCAVRVPLE